MKEVKIMSKYKKIVNKILQGKKPKCCDTCDNCVYIGEGDYFCDENMVIVKEDHVPNENYNYCNECDWKEQE